MHFAMLMLITSYGLVCDNTVKGLRNTESVITNSVGLRDTASVITHSVAYAIQSL